MAAAMMSRQSGSITGASDDVARGTPRPSAVRKGCLPTLRASPRIGDTERPTIHRMLGLVLSVMPMRAIRVRSSRVTRSPWMT